MSDYGDWAWAYDALYAARGQDRTAEAAEFLDVASEHLDRAPSSWLDVACGTGAHLEELGKRIDRVAGVDLSPEMVAVAAARLPDINIRVADMCTLNLGATFDVVSCLFSSVGHMPDGEHLDMAVVAMAGHVEPGGVLMIQPWIERSTVREGGVRDVVAAEVDGNPVTRVVSSRWDGEAIHLDMAYSTANADGVRTGEVHLRMPVFTRERHLQSFRDAGLVDVEWLSGRDALGRGLILGRKPSS